MAHQSIFASNDDETYLQLIQEILNDTGYPNVVWHVGDGAFHRIRDEQPDLLLLDISMKNPARGWSTLDSVRLHPATQHIPVVLCTTDMRLVNDKAALLRELNCQTLEKPFELETLLDRVAAAIGPPTS